MRILLKLIQRNRVCFYALCESQCFYVKHIKLMNWVVKSSENTNVSIEVFRFPRDGAQLTMLCVLFCSFIEQFCFCRNNSVALPPQILFTKTYSWNLLHLLHYRESENAFKGPVHCEKVENFSKSNSFPFHVVAYKEILELQHFQYSTSFLAVGYRV